MTDANTTRLESLDALRGFDMLFISGLAGLISALCALFPGDCSSWIDAQMHHAAWDGFFHHDSIFPLFIFLAGVSFPYSYAKSRSKGMTSARIYRKAILRALTLFFLGFLVNGLLKSADFPVRFFSVLGRIGITGLVSSVLFMNFKTGTRAAIAAITLLAYYGLSLIVAPDAPAGASSFSVEGSFAAYLDRKILPTQMIYKQGIYDPEGLLSTLPAVVTAMLGNFTGEFIRESRLSGGRKTLVMAAAGAVLLGLGLLWSNWLPINKALWSSSYVLVVGAYSVLMFALFYWIIDVKGWRKWAFPLKVVGMNSIAVYMLQRIVDFEPSVKFFLGKVISNLSPEAGNVIYYCGYLLLVWLILFFLYRKKVFLKV